MTIVLAIWFVFTMVIYLFVPMVNRCSVYTETEEYKKTTVPGKFGIWMFVIMIVAGDMFLMVSVLHRILDYRG